MLPQISRNKYFMETGLRMTEELPFVIGYDLISKIAGHEILAHWHNVLEFIYIEEGEILFSCENGSRLLCAGEGVIVNSNVLHAYHKTEDSDCKYIVLNFHPSLLGMAEKNSISKQYMLPFINGEKKFRELYLSQDIPSHVVLIRKIYDLLALWENKTDGFELRLQSELLQLWYLLYTAELRSLPDAPQTDINAQRVQKALQFIQENYTKKITLKDIAKYCSISEAVCWRLFRHQLDQSPMEYVTKYRIRISLDLLKNPLLPITQVAEQCGFDSHSYYSKIFKTIMNCTPKEYRKNNT